MDLRTLAVARYWAEFCARSGVAETTTYDVVRFGDSDEMADRLLALVRTGPKRATAGLLEDYDDAEPVPEVDAYSVIVDGSNTPACVIQTTDVAIKPIREVDAAFAWDEGEGDRSLAYWMNAHTNCFTRRLAEQNRTFTDDMPVVLERFAVRWPELHEAAEAR